MANLTLILITGVVGYAIGVSMATWVLGTLGVISGVILLYFQIALGATGTSRTRWEKLVPFLMISSLNLSMWVGSYLQDGVDFSPLKGIFSLFLR